MVAVGFGMIQTENEIQQLLAEFVIEGGVSAADFDFLASACADPARLRRLLRRRQLGEPREYVVGYQDFRGRRFAIDKRVYITDPELTHLVGAVVSVGRSILEERKRPPVLVEFGAGCGSLAISVKKELPGARVIGLDLDGDAIAVAAENARLHQADVWLLESDFFSALPPELVPDLIFGDPPWGDETSLYDEGRPASHYQAMPILSAFPSGGITAVHEAILRSVGSRGWDAEVLLNLGTLGDEHVAPLQAMTATHEILRFENGAILRCKVEPSG